MATSEEENDNDISRLFLPKKSGPEWDEKPEELTSDEEQRRRQQSVDRERERSKELADVRSYLGLEPIAPLLQHEKQSLWELAEKGPVSGLAVLVVGGADCNQQESGRRFATPLHYACLQKRPDAAALLLANGASPDGRTGGDPDSCGQTPLMWAVQQASVHDWQWAVPELLLASGADINATDDRGRSVLVHALAVPATACWLVSKGARVAAAPQGALGRTAAHWAAAKGHYLGLLYLADRYPQLLPGARDAEGHSPLHLACAGGHLNAVKTLLAHGADPDFVSGAGLAPHELPGVPPRVHKLLLQCRSAAPAARSKLAQPDFSNWDTIMQRDKARNFLLAFFLPNIGLAVASRLPAVFGLLAMVLLIGVLIKVAVEGTRSRKPDPGLAGFYFGALFHGGLVLVFVAFPVLDMPRTKALWWAVTPLMALCYLRTLLGDPGAVRSTAHDREKIYRLIESGAPDPEAARWLDPTTMAAKPCRAKYCTTTLKLVHRFDHYCVWTCNAIGAGNHRPFYAFAVLQFISQCIVQVASTYYIFWYSWRLHPDEAALAARFDPCAWVDWMYLPAHTLVSYFLFFYNMAVIGFIFSVVCGQGRLISRNLTSNEAWNSSRYPWVITIRGRTFCRYDKGCWGNWAEFLSGASLEVTDTAPPPLTPYLQRIYDASRKGGPADVAAVRAAIREPSPAAAPAPQPRTAPELQGAARGDEAARGFLHDESSGLFYPSELQHYVTQLPASSLRDIAARQRKLVHELGMVAADGSLRAPPKGRERELHGFMQEQLAAARSAAAGQQRPPSPSAAGRRSAENRSASGGGAGTRSRSGNLQDPSE